MKIQKKRTHNFVVNHVLNFNTTQSWKLENIFYNKLKTTIFFNSKQKVNEFVLNKYKMILTGFLMLYMIIILYHFIITNEFAYQYHNSLNLDLFKLVLSSRLIYELICFIYKLSFETKKNIQSSTRKQLALEL